MTFLMYVRTLNDALCLHTAHSEAQSNLESASHFLRDRLCLGPILSVTFVMEKHCCISVDSCYSTFPSSLDEVGARVLL